MTDFLNRLREELEALKGAEAYRALREIAPAGHGRARWDGREVWNLSSNDYLGVAADAALAQAFREWSEEDAGLSAASSRLLTGNHPSYGRLEEALGRFYGGRAALVFNSGYHANIGILPALVGKGDLIVSDKLNHASIIDGLRLGAAEYRRCRHLDYQQMGDLLAEAQGRYRQTFLVVESIFSMDGDAADLTKLVALKKEFGAVLVVDEAHSVGTHGRDGRGLAEAQGVMEEVDVLIGTFGKAFGSAGAYAITHPTVREYLVNAMRSLIFTTGLPPVVTEWSRFILERMPEFESRRRHLQRLGDGLRRLFAGHGFQTGGMSHIVPLMAGSNARAGELARKFQQHGILVFPIRPPTVPPGTARLRFSLTAALPETVLAAVEEVLS